LIPALLTMREDDGGPMGTIGGVDSHPNPFPRAEGNHGVRPEGEGSIPGDELLVVLPVERLQSAGPAAGFDPSPRRVLDLIFKSGATRTLRRSLAEDDPRFKQLVAYVAFRWQGQIFHYLRSPRVGEQRLAGRRSIGIGGHLNASDVGDRVDDAGLRRAMRRELREEVELGEEPEIRYVGIIDDDQEPVSRVHLGIVAVAELREPRLTLRDPTLADGRFDPPADVLARLDEFEGWSRLCLPALLGAS
jgi:predicted NUDIX family phosphoesterase